jgi:hypothetical protein
MGALLVYLNANIVNVGEMGTALPVLAGYVGLSLLVFALLWQQRRLIVRMHLFLFFLLIAWIALRTILDLGDLEYLKRLTIATTGGMMLFYLVGSFLAVSYETLIKKARKNTFVKLVVLLFLCLLLWMAYIFSQRLHPRLFYLTGVDGSYQRSGNFLSISFIVTSFTYLLYSCRQIEAKARSLSAFFWLVIYTLSTFVALVGSQLFGSNSASGVILGVYLITLVMSLLVASKGLWFGYIRGEVALPWSKKLLRRLVLLALVGLMLFITLVALAVQFTSFDINSTRMLGFGSGTNISLLSRVEILRDTGANQMGYAPFLGNMNVAYITTGNAGHTLHSFLPHVMANLGLVGVSIVIALFMAVFVQLYRDVTLNGHNRHKVNYQECMFSLYSIFILLYILFFANISTGLSWAVLWFTFGFISKPIGFKKYEKYS